MEDEAVIWKDQSCTYDWVLERFARWREKINVEGIKRGAIVVLEADFSPNSVALFLALADHGCILVPLTDSVRAKKAEFVSIAQGEISFALDSLDDARLSRLSSEAAHPLYQQLRESRHPGLVLFSSGSTGESK